MVSRIFKGVLSSPAEPLVLKELLILAEPMWLGYNETFTILIRNVILTVYHKWRSDGFMKTKKWIGLTTAFLVGVFVAASSEDVSAQVISMIGKKVTGEYTVVVNGKTLPDKGSIIDGRANVPVRALSESLGADIKVEGKTITVTAEETVGTDKVVILDGKYYTKYDLLNEKKRLEDALVSTQNSLVEEESKATEMETTTGIVKELWLKQINFLNDKIKQTNERLTKVNEALKAFE